MKTLIPVLFLTACAPITERVTADLDRALGGEVLAVGPNCDGDRTCVEFDEDDSLLAPFELGRVTISDGRFLIHLSPSIPSDQLELVVAHELAHVLGIKHVSDPKSVMFGVLQTHESLADAIDEIAILVKTEIADVQPVVDALNGLVEVEVECVGSSCRRSEK